MPRGDWRKTKTVSAFEYFYTAEQVKSYRELSRWMNLAYASMIDDLQKRGIYAQVGALFLDGENRGPKRPPVPLIEGADGDVKPDMEDLYEAVERRFDAKAERAVAKLDQHIRFEHGPVAIFFLGDQHFGNHGTNVRRAREEQAEIMQTPASYVFQMGDTLDNFIVGRLIAENFKPSAPIREQWWIAEDYLMKFKDKLLAAVGGNHEAWTLKVSGIDFAREVTPNGVLYDADEIKVTIHVGGHEYRVWARHKWSHSSQYNQTHGQEWSAHFESADHDIYVGAHKHTGAVAREFTLNAEKKLSVQIGSYKVHDDYAKVANFPANDGSTACGVVLHDDGTWVTASDVSAIQKYMSAVYPG